jgi:hypothetical protein
VTDTTIRLLTAGSAVSDGDLFVSRQGADTVDKSVTALQIKNYTSAESVIRSDYSPSHSILVQQSGTGSPTALQVGNNTLVGRLSGGGSAIDDLSPTDVRTLLSISNVDNTSDLNKPVSTATQTALNGKENTITAGTTAQYYRGDKTFQTLNTAAVPESGSLYFTDERAQDAVLSVISASGGVTYSYNDAANTAAIGITYGTTAGTACQGNDARLSNARTPLAHTHVAADVTDFSEAVDDRVNSLLVPGSNVTLTYNDAANTLTIAASGGGGGGGTKPPVRFNANGFGNVPQVGRVKYIRIPYAGTITSWTLTAFDANGAPVSANCVVDIWKDTDANYPPVAADSIPSPKPTLSAQNKASSSSLGSWVTTSIAAGEWLAFKIDSIDTATEIDLMLEIT